MPPVAVHYNDEFFPNPWRFNPERFTNGEPQGYFPFGGGYVPVRRVLLATTLLINYRTQFARLCRQNDEPASARIDSHSAAQTISLHAPGPSAVHHQHGRGIQLETTQLAV